METIAIWDGPLATMGEEAHMYIQEGANYFNCVPYGEGQTWPIRMIDVNTPPDPPMRFLEYHRTTNQDEHGHYYFAMQKP